MTPTVFIIILNWNGKENTIACLRSIAGLQTTDLDRKVASSAYRLQTIVVDNGSTDDSKTVISNFSRQLRDPAAAGQFPISNIQYKFIANKENLGYAGGTNVGIRHALDSGADYVLILNNDTLVDEHLIEELLKVPKENNRVGIVAPKIYFAKGFEFHKDRYKEHDRGKVIWYAGGVMDWKNVIGHHRGVDEVDHQQYRRSDETDYASGCCMFIKREVLEKVGFFDEKYFLYYEDADLSERTKKHGYKIVYAPKAVLWHKNAGSAGGSGSALQDYYISRNRMLFAMRYAPIRSKVAIVRESLHLIANGRPWQKRGVKDFYLGKFGKGSFNI